LHNVYVYFATCGLQLLLCDIKDLDKIHETTTQLVIYICTIFHIITD